MKICRIFACTLATSCVILVANFSVDMAHAEEGFGTITGQVVYDGPVPKRKLLFRKSDPNAKDPEICAAGDLYADDLIIDPKTKGIANVFVYIYFRNAKGMTIHPSLKKPKKNEVVLDQKGCRFIPHAMIIRAGQTVVLKSQDACSHNTRSTAIKNEAFNISVPANDREGIRKNNQQQAEILPLPVECNIHPWMKAWWLTIDHPYATITDKHGKFKIEKLPAGTFEFRVWHERVGYIDQDPVKERIQHFQFTVESGTAKKDKITPADPIKVPPKAFE